MDELVGRLEAIQKLLIILLSDPKYKLEIEMLKVRIYDEYGSRLNSLFPSDPQYQQIQSESRFISNAVDEIMSNIEFAESLKL